MHRPRDLSFGAAAYEAPRSHRRLIVIRGDLYSDTGYGRATRALKSVLADHASHIFGVSLHEHKKRRQNAIDFPLVSDEELHAKPIFRDAIVLNICLPDDFVRIANAYNIGYFFWETEAMPRCRFWKARLLMMDRLWAPSLWQSEYLAAACNRDEVPVVPWPLDIAPKPARTSVSALAEARCHLPMNALELDNFLLRAGPGEQRSREKQLEAEDHAEGRSARFDPGLSPSFGDLRSRGGDLFVAVQTDAPRKGMPLLLSSWLRFKASRAGRDAKLIIKMSSLDVEADLYRTHFHASLAVHRAARRCGVEQPDVWFIHDRLQAEEIRALLRTADAFVSATMGEGFGGPVAESLLEGTPVITPRHTSIQDIMLASYPLIVATEPHRLKLWNNIDVYYAASEWNVVDDEAFVDRLQVFAHLSTSERRAIAKSARDSLLAHVGRPAVGARLGVELARCDVLQREVARMSAGPPFVPAVDLLALERKAAPC